MTLRTIGLLALAIGCGEKGQVTPTGDTSDTDTVTSGDTDTDTTPVTTPNCANAVLDRYPAEGDTDIHARSAIDVLLSQPDATATIVVTDGDGNEVAGTVNRLDSDRRLEFLPGEDYASGASYTATVQWACDDRPITFTAGDAGTTPVADANDLIGRTYSLDLKNGRFVAPDGIGAALQTMLEVKLLLGVVGTDGTSLDLRAAAEDAKGGQDLTTPTTDFTEAADFANPYFEVTQGVLPLVIEGDPINVVDLSISGSFEADGSAISGFRMSGIVDTRDLKDAVGVSGDEQVCQLFGASFNVQCEACPEGGDYCITLVVADLPMPETGFSLQAVD